MASIPPKLRIRGMILTAGVAAITMVGTFYGADLKSDHNTEKQRKAMAAVPASSSVSAAPPPASTRSSTDPLPAPEDDFIAALQSRRSNLEHTRQSWEKKAAKLRQRMEAAASASASEK